MRNVKCDKCGKRAKVEGLGISWVDLSGNGFSLSFCRKCYDKFDDLRRICVRMLVRGFIEKCEDK
jgi:hypothetical protein